MGPAPEGPALAAAGRRADRGGHRPGRPGAAAEPVAAGRRPQGLPDGHENRHPVLRGRGPGVPPGPAPDQHRRGPGPERPGHHQDRPVRRAQLLARQQRAARRPHPVPGDRVAGRIPPGPGGQRPGHLGVPVRPAGAERCGQRARRAGRREAAGVRRGAAAGHRRPEPAAGQGRQNPHEGDQRDRGQGQPRRRCPADGPPADRAGPAGRHRRTETGAAGESQPAWAGAAGAGG